MGRTVPSNPVISPNQKRDARAKRAKQTVNKDIPALLAAYPRARKGVEGAEVFGKAGLNHDHGVTGGRVAVTGVGNATGEVNTASERAIRKGRGRKKSLGQERRRAAIEDAEGDDDSEIATAGAAIHESFTTEGVMSRQSNSGTGETTVQHHSYPVAPRQPHIRIRVADTLDAAHDLLDTLSASPKSRSQSHNQPHITILNMSSPLRPGGGFLTGATSQEESLCMRTTLYPSLREEFYRLPEVGGVYTPDVLVFRGSDANVTDLNKNERWWIDVVSAGMLRFPDVEADEDGEMRYVNARDRELVEEKMRAVMRIVQVKTMTKKKSGKGLVLGAWGCGAYGNPVREIAESWKRVLIGNMNNADHSGKAKGEKAGQDAEIMDQERRSWSDIEIVFAIKERKMATQFAGYFGEGIEVEIDKDQDGNEAESQEDESETADAELQDKIAELTGQIASSRSEAQRAMLTKMLQKLRLDQADEG